MSADRELLELAAKAVGYRWDAHGIDGAGNWWTGTEYLENWNPLTDDGDALRLAVKLRINVMNFKHDIVAEGSAGHVWERRGDDAAAARRAIVRAAAEIGKAMP